jgi:hypothetical protein
VVTRELDPESVSALAPWAALLDAKQEREREQLDGIQRELVSLVERMKEMKPSPKTDLSAFADQVLAFEIRRPDYKSSDDDLPKLTAWMNAAAKIKLADGFLRNVYTSSRVWRPGEPDDFLLDEAVRLAKEAPSPTLLPALATIDPRRPNVTSTKESVMDAILEIGAAIVKAHPPSVAKVRDLVDQLFDDGAIASDAVKDRTRKIIGTLKKKPPAEAILELTPGEMSRLAGGERVRWQKDDQGGFALSIASGEESTEWSFDAKEDWYREWWNAPYLIVSKQVNPTKIHVRLTPHKAEPKEHEQPELLSLAKKVSERRGCPTYVSDDYDASKGRFEYVAEGPGGKRCTMLYGTRSGRVVRMTP